MPHVSRSRTRIRGTRTIQESAALIGCSYSAVVAMLDRNELPFIQAGNRRLPTVAGLEAKLGKKLSELEAAAAA
jgi:excisionase family DNA binding protein